MHHHLKAPVHTFCFCYLCNGNGLLLHHLVDGCAVSISHLVKLIDAADAQISQHQSSTFQGHFSRQGVTHHCCRQTNTGRPSTSCVLA